MPVLLEKLGMNRVIIALLSGTGLWKNEMCVYVPRRETRGHYCMSEYGGRQIGLCLHRSVVVRVTRTLQEFCSPHHTMPSFLSPD